VKILYVGSGAEKKLILEKYGKFELLNAEL
jgi:hypothetical protein